MPTPPPRTAQFTSQAILAIDKAEIGNLVFSDVGRAHQFYLNRVIETAGISNPPTIFNHETHQLTVAVTKKLKSALAQQIAREKDIAAIVQELHVGIAVSVQEANNTLEQKLADAHQKVDAGDYYPEIKNINLKNVKYEKDFAQTAQEMGGGATRQYDQIAESIVANHEPIVGAFTARLVQQRANPTTTIQSTEQPPGRSF